MPINTNPLNKPPVVTDLVQVYPNPVQYTLYIHGKKNLRKPLLIQVCDIYGRVLKQGTSFKNDFTVDVSDLKPGAYLFKLYNGYDREVQIEKFIKE